MFGRSQNNWEKKKNVPNNRCKDTHMYVCVYVCMYLYVCNTHISVFLFVLFGHAAYGILVPWPGIELGPSAMRAWSPNY